ncbi:hypothetical protein J2R80_002031 [Bradyrhizobium sp. USDA 4541]|nr:hypothetical protein [Bradyrhizobium sp. USDA 4541]
MQRSRQIARKEQCSTRSSAGVVNAACNAPSPRYGQLSTQFVHDMFSCIWPRGERV